MFMLFVHLGRNSDCFIVAKLNEYKHQSYKLEILGAIPKATTSYGSTCCSP